MTRPACRSLFVIQCLPLPCRLPEKYDRPRSPFCPSVRASGGQGRGEGGDIWPRILSLPSIAAFCAYCAKRGKTARIAYGRREKKSYWRLQTTFASSVKSTFALCDVCLFWAPVVLHDHSTPVSSPTNLGRKKKGFACTYSKAKDARNEHRSGPAVEWTRKSKAPGKKRGKKGRSSARIKTLLVLFFPVENLCDAPFPLPFL